MSEARVHPLCVARTYEVARVVFGALKSATSAVMAENPNLRRYLIDSWKPALKEAVGDLEKIKDECIPSKSAKKLIDFAIRHIRTAIESKDPETVRLELEFADAVISDAMRYLEHYIQFGEEVPI